MHLRYDGYHGISSSNDLSLHEVATCKLGLEYVSISTLFFINLRIEKNLRNVEKCLEKTRKEFRNNFHFLFSLKVNRSEVKQIQSEWKHFERKQTSSYSAVHFDRKCLNVAFEHIHWVKRGEEREKQHRERKTHRNEQNRLGNLVHTHACACKCVCLCVRSCETMLSSVVCVRFTRKLSIISLF